MTDKPVLRCLVAVMTPAGRLTTTFLVPLQVAVVLKERYPGMWVIGPDPEDEIALTRWEQWDRAIRSCGL